jgi:hypothetical protein
MGLEKLLNHFNPLNPYNSHSSTIKTLGFAGFLVSILGYSGFFPHQDIEPRDFLYAGLISAGIYLTGVVSDYIASKKTSIFQLERNIKKWTQKAYQGSSDSKKALKSRPDFIPEDQEQKRIFNEMVNIYPHFHNQKFLKEYPGIKEVAFHIYSEIKNIEIRGGKLLQIWSRFPLFYEMELTKFPQYLNLLRRGNPKVVENYKQLKEKVCH